MAGKHDSFLGQFSNFLESLPLEFWIGSRKGEISDGSFEQSVSRKEQMLLWKIKANPSRRVAWSVYDKGL